MTQQGDTRSVHQTRLVIDRELYECLRGYVNAQNSAIHSPARWTITGVIKAAIAEYLDRHQLDTDTERVA